MFLEDQHTRVAHQVEQDNWEHDAQTRLSMAIKTLDERSQYILQTRWLQEDKATLHDLAAHYQVSAERIRQIEKSALNKLKQAMA